MKCKDCKFYRTFKVTQSSILDKIGSPVIKHECHRVWPEPGDNFEETQPEWSCQYFTAKEKNED